MTLDPSRGRELLLAHAEAARAARNASSEDGNIVSIMGREIRAEHALRDWLFDNAHALIRIAREKAES